MPSCPTLLGDRNAETSSCHGSWLHQSTRSDGGRQPGMPCWQENRARARSRISMPASTRRDSRRRSRRSTQWLTSARGMRAGSTDLRSLRLWQPKRRWQQAGLKVSEANRERVGIIIGTGIGGIQTILDTYDVCKERGPDRVSPFLIPDDDFGQRGRRAGHPHGRARAEHGAGDGLCDRHKCDRRRRRHDSPR